MKEYKILAHTEQISLPTIVNGGRLDNTLVTVVIETGVKGWKAYQGIILYQEGSDSMNVIQRVAAHGVKMDRDAACKMFPQFQKEMYNV
jgi:hypothetical protein